MRKDGPRRRLTNSLGKRPIVFIAHSLGGLIVKQMLRVCADSSDPTYKHFLIATRAVVFCGTPHEGAGLATVVRDVLRHIASKHVKELALSDDALLDLSNWFRNWVAQSKPQIRAYYETKKTYGVIIVSKASANPGIAGCTPISIDADHINMCKPETHESQLYLAVKSLIQTIPNDVEPTLPLAVSGLPTTLAQTTSNDSPATSIASLARRQLSAKSVFALAQSESNNSPALLSIAPVALPSFDPALGCTSTQADLMPKPELLVDYEYFTTQAPHDRRPLAEKLVSAGRDYEVKDAQRKKERFAMALRRHAAQASSLARLTRLMSDVESRFNRHVRPAIQKHSGETKINRLIQDLIITPVVEAQLAETEDVTSTLIESSLYYLAGNCHVRWDADKN